MLPAHEALRVELPEHGRDAPALDGSAAVGAGPGAEQGRGAGLAVRLPLFLPERGGTELLAAAGAAEQVQPPGAAHGGDGLTMGHIIMVTMSAGAHLGLDGRLLVQALPQVTQGNLWRPAKKGGINLSDALNLKLAQFRHQVVQLWKRNDVTPYVSIMLYLTIDGSPSLSGPSALLGAG